MKIKSIVGLALIASALSIQAQINIPIQFTATNGVATATTNAAGQVIITLPPGWAPLTAAQIISNNAAGTQTAPSTGNFISTGISWIANINPNISTFGTPTNAAAQYDIWTAPVFLGQANVADALALEYYPSTNSAFYAQNIVLNAGVAGTFVGDELNAGYSILRKYDVNLSVGGGAGYERNLNNINVEKLSPAGEVFVQILKSFCNGGFVGGRIELQYAGHKIGSPPVYVMIGDAFN